LRRCSAEATAFCPAVGLFRATEARIGRTERDRATSADRGRSRVSPVRPAGPIQWSTCDRSAATVGAVAGFKGRVISSGLSLRVVGAAPPATNSEETVSTEENKAVVGRWFTEFWGNPWNPEVVDELAAPGIQFEYSMHEPRRGRDEVKKFATEFREAFPDLNFWGTADLIAQGEYVVGQWEGGGTHTGPAFDDLPVGSLPAASGKTMRFTGTTVLRVQDGMITEEIGLDDGVRVLKQLGLIPER
jgi:predicted ester cyclase